MEEEQEQEQRKRKEEEAAERKRSRRGRRRSRSRGRGEEKGSRGGGEEEEEKKRKDEEEENRKTKEEETSYFPIFIVPTSYSWDEKKTAIRDIYGMPENYWYHKAMKFNVSTSEPIFVDSQESTDTLPMGKKEGRRDYVAREVLGVDDKFLIERFLNECIIIDELMFGDTLEGYDNFLSFKDIQNLLFARESESVIIDCYVNTCLLDRAPTEVDLLFSPMHVGTNHWALLVIKTKEKEFHVYDSLRNKDRRDIPQYVEELRRYIKGKHIDSENWSLRYPDPCPQQGSGDDCAIFTCKYMECLARRDIQGFPFSQDDMPIMRAKFALHFIKAYFNAQEHSKRI
ncbi:hypothetical protein Taro_033547 [Colocasia esculenta]|uniref:Ubiquitin-like protease family profile domain-containing protein n=1 Tax=Colocasia esculenta TaxID=4460 RepID=A0A843VVK1_COLES|nr:hypothetical protein [Colocasia esculenta]